MEIFYDTSVLVPLLLLEDGSERAKELWRRTETAWAWDWAKVECEAALGRRHAGPGAWAKWRELVPCLRFLQLREGFPALCEFNRFLAMRATDAGHLFVADRLARSRPACHVATFDREMRTAVPKLGLRLAEDDQL